MALFLVQVILRRNIGHGYRRVYAMNMVRPRISVITATVNRRDLLRRAIESVLAQGLDGVEHIVVDNVSTDGTAEMLAEYPHLIVIREPDRCLYEAWNKGLRRASGAIFCFLNSDDELPSGAFARITATLGARPNLDMISGSVEIRRTPPDRAVETRLVDDARMLALREQDVGPGIPLTNGRYLTPGLVARVGLFDERYRLVSDRDYLLRVLLSAPVNVTVSAPLYRYHVHDGSLTLTDTGAVRRLSIESLAAARNGFLEAPTDEARNAYARWHAWATSYAAGVEARDLQFGAAAQIVADAFRRDPAWPLRLPMPILRHIRERAARRGHPVAT
jgi:glycosyltransferase involved in cell wall biosynthesis